MSTQNAKELSIAQKALGSSLEEIVWIPELREHYHELRKLVNETQAPKEDLELIRKMGFEYTKFKVLLISASEHIAASLIKYIKSNLVDIKKWMESANKWLKETLPIWTDKIARFLSSFWNVGQAVIELIKNIIHALPEASRAFTLFFAAIALGLKLNPTLVMLAALFIMIEDWWQWNEGKKDGKGSRTVFDAMWESLESVKGPFTETLKSLNEVMKALFGQSFALTFWDAFNAVISSIAMGISTIVYGFKNMIDLAKYALTYFGDDKKLKEIDKEYEGQKQALYKKYDPSGKDKMRSYLHNPEFQKEDKTLNEAYQAKRNLFVARRDAADMDKLVQGLTSNETAYYKVIDAITIATLKNKKKMNDYTKQQEQGAKAAGVPSNANTLGKVIEADKGGTVTPEQVNTLLGQSVSSDAKAWDFNTGKDKYGNQRTNMFVFPNATIVTPDPYNFVDQAMQISAQRGFSMFGSTAPAGGR
jgi:hypothetical protein